MIAAIVVGTMAAIFMPRQQPPPTVPSASAATVATPRTPTPQVATPRTPTPQSVRIGGTVADDRGSPVGRAHLHFQDACSGTPLAEADTDESGHYDVAFTAVCSARVTVTAQGLETHQQDVALSDNSARTFVLHPAVELTAGQAVTLVISPNDQRCDEWRMDSNDWPCRIVHVRSTAKGRLTVHVVWQDADNELGLQAFPRGTWMEDAPCCESSTITFPVDDTSDATVEVLFLNLGFRPSGGPAHGPQTFTLNTSLDTH